MMTQRIEPETCSYWECPNEIKYMFDRDGSPPLEQDRSPKWPQFSCNLHFHFFHESYEDIPGIRETTLSRKER